LPGEQQILSREKSGTKFTEQIASGNTRARTEQDVKLKPKYEQ